MSIRNPNYRLQAAGTALLMGVALAHMSSGCAQSSQQQAQVAPTKSPGQVAYEAGMAAGKRQKWEQAATHFETAVAASVVGSAQRHQAQLNLAIAQERTGDLDAAEAGYRALLEQNPSQQPQGQAAASKAAEPQTQALTLHLARVLSAQGKHSEAADLIHRLVEQSPEDHSLRQQYATALRRSGQGQAAIVQARRILLRQQDDVAAMKTLALVYVDQGKLALAETQFKNALKMSKDDASIFANLGLIADRRGEHQLAIKWFERALKHNPKLAEAHANVGAIALRYRDYQRATKHYQKAMKLGLVTCETLKATGYALEGQQQGKKAVTQLRKAYAACPTDTELLYAVGNICMGQLRDNKCALEMFQKYTVENGGKEQEGNKVAQLIQSLRQMEADAAAEGTASNDAPEPDAAPAAPNKESP